MDGELNKLITERFYSKKPKEREINKAVRVWNDYAEVQRIRREGRKSWHRILGNFLIGDGYNFTFKRWLKCLL